MWPPIHSPDNCVWSYRQSSDFDKGIHKVATIYFDYNNYYISVHVHRWMLFVAVLNPGLNDIEKLFCIQNKFHRHIQPHSTSKTG